MNCVMDRGSTPLISTIIEKNCVVAGFLLFSLIVTVSMVSGLFIFSYFSHFLSFFVVWGYFLFSTAYLLLTFRLYFSSLFFQLSFFKSVYYRFLKLLHFYLTPTILFFQGVPLPSSLPKHILSIITKYTLFPRNYLNTFKFAIFT